MPPLEQPDAAGQKGPSPKMLKRQEIFASCVVFFKGKVKKLGGIKSLKNHWDCRLACVKPALHFCNFYNYGVRFHFCNFL
jgi:hypothetical protein